MKLHIFKSSLLNMFNVNIEALVEIRMFAILIKKTANIQISCSAYRA